MPCAVQPAALLAIYCRIQAKQERQIPLPNQFGSSSGLEEEEEAAAANLNLICNGRPHLSDPAQPDPYFCSGMGRGGIRSEYIHTLLYEMRSRAGRRHGLPCPR